LDSALQSAIKARDLYIKVKRPDRKFQYDLQNRIYHQTAYLGNWRHALEQAHLGYNFLKDTLPKNNKIFVDLIYDIGFIYSQLGDYSKAVENYQTSLDLYRKIIGENNTDVAQAYNNIAVEYRGLGLRKKELESLLKAKSIWEQLNDEKDQQFLYRCYGNLFYWYSYYGDFDKAEEYILKKDRLRTIAKTTKTNRILRNKEEIYEDRLSEWYDLMLHYSRKKDTVKTISYADTILKSIDTNKKLLNFEERTLSSTLKLYASFIKEKNNPKALILLDKAINIQEKYQSIYYTKPFSFYLSKADLLLQTHKYLDASLVLKHLNLLKDKEEISNRFKLSILNAKVAQELNETEMAKSNFDDAFTLVNTSKKDIESIEPKDLMPLISFETIDGFLAMGDFYLDQYNGKKSNSNLKKATHRFVLASKIYNQLYLGQRYNERLFTTNNAINERLLTIALEQSNNVVLLSEIINTIENNSSKLTWSKFVFNNQRQQIQLPENILNQEEGLKAQLNFYQNTLINSEENSEEKIELWKNKIYELTNQLTALQDSIKEQSQTYYRFNLQNFKIADLQKSLKDAEVVVKYMLTDTNLYSFLISKDRIQIVLISDKSKAVSTLKVCLNNLKQRGATYKESFDDLKTLLFHSINYQDYHKLTIIPDGALHYFPFEALILDKNMPLISYASSLLLYQEQKAAPSMFESLKIAAFSASNNHSKLPKASDEIEAILKIFDGKAFLNASKTEFLQHANEFNVLHIAMHSNIDEANPEFSSLNFYGETDNRLFISELYNEAFKANMAVLSACDTGNGFFENGEGVISLSRAFNYAGVPSTVMSLWKVDDEATAKIMSFFYQHLSEGEAKDEALKNAKLDYLKHTEDDLLKHPYYWSGFVLTGNTDPIIKSYNYWMYLSIAPIIVLGFFRKRLFQFFKK
jgi:CHAT domain-containing protein